VWCGIILLAKLPGIFSRNALENMLEENTVGELW
jgi:hypothetical protein